MKNEVTFQITIKRPEGYDDVCSELVYQDFVENPKWFEVLEIKEVE